MTRPARRALCVRSSPMPASRHFRKNRLWSSDCATNLTKPVAAVTSLAGGSRVPGRLPGRIPRRGFTPGGLCARRVPVRDGFTPEACAPLRASLAACRINWRRGWDSNPRGNLRPLHAFQACQLSHSCTSPDLLCLRRHLSQRAGVCSTPQSFAPLRARVAPSAVFPWPRTKETGGEGGIRTHETRLGPTDFRDRLLQPLGHLSVAARSISMGMDVPAAGAAVRLAALPGKVRLAVAGTAPRLHGCET